MPPPSRLLHPPRLRLRSLCGTSAPPFIIRRAASSNPPPTRRTVTVANDDGRVRWTDLRAREKVARGTQQSFNLLVIVAGLGLTGTVGYLLYRDVFSTSSTTRHFQRASTRVQNSPACQALLGSPRSIVAYGNSRWSSYARARIKAPPAAVVSETRDPSTGVRTVKLRFFVRGDRAEGWVQARLVKADEDAGYVFELLTLDVEGQQRVYVEGRPEKAKGSPDGRVFGIKWR